MMRNYARVNGETVAELLETDGDIQAMFHPSIAWIECDAAVGLGWKYTDGEFLPPVATPEPTIAAMQATALALLPGWEQTERAAGIEYDGHFWLTTPAAVQDIRDVLLAGVVPYDVWRDATGTPVPMTIPELRALWIAMVTRGADIDRRRFQMETEVRAMSEAQLIAFKPGWPA